MTLTRLGPDGHIPWPLYIFRQGVGARARDSLRLGRLVGTLIPNSCQLLDDRESYVHGEPDRGA
jgi:hypothetical protein